MNVIFYFVLFFMVAGWQRDFAPQTAKLAALPTPVPENTRDPIEPPTGHRPNQKPKTKNSIGFSFILVYQFVAVILVLTLASVSRFPLPASALVTHRFLNFGTPTIFFVLSFKVMHMPPERSYQSECGLRDKN